MMKQSQTFTALPAGAAVAAKLSLGAAGAFLVLLAVLHIIKPEFDPAWHMISEYSIGQYGWVMQTTFVSIALSCVGLAAALWTQARTAGGRIGLALLVLAAIGMTIAGFNVTDPIGTAAAQMSVHGNMHGLGFMIGVPSVTIGMTLLTLSLRRNSAWSPVRRTLGWLVVVAWLSLVGMAAVFAVLLPAHDGVFGPGVIVGWPNRLYIIACAIWLAIAAWQALRLRK